MYTRNRTFLTLAVVAMASLFVPGASADAGIIVAEDFGGDGSSPLTGTSADTFDAAITTAGGSATWAAANNATRRLDDGTSLTGDSTSYLALGSYINDAKGTSSGLFTLSATLIEASSYWITLGFFYNAPTADINLNANMAATQLVKSSQTQHLRGPGKNTVGTTSSSGATLVTIVLDLTPTEYDPGSGKFGTATWYNGTTATSPTASYTWTADIPFVAIGMSSWKGSDSVSALTLSQVFEPTALTGDTNGDDVVDAFDFITLKRNFGTSGAGVTEGNFTGPGDTEVNWDDLSILMSSMGPGSGLAPSTVPEPCSAMLLVFGAAALLRRRRKA